ncbi:hypothetical protein A4X06_0g8193 [Tilletia controversa]|uniref:Uncharacterized protein n=1 Tax=Tilletia controversa TaxID=13291 RepID=A0A8X7ML44_9BASI|nr:hypothetical protein A4X06_0g8193 [Tilletia controversa]
MSSALGVLIPPLRFSVIAAIGPSQFQDGVVSAEEQRQQRQRQQDGQGEVTGASESKRERESGQQTVAGRHPKLSSKAERRLRAQLSETIYRGTYPKPRNLPFLSRLYLRAILSLTPKPPAEIGFGPSTNKDKDSRRGGASGSSGGSGNAFKAWADAHGIRLLHIEVPSIKDRSPAALPAEDVQRVLSILTDRANLPSRYHIVHCKKLRIDVL